MSVTLTVKGDTKKVAQHLKRFNKRAVPKVSARALNHTAKQGESITLKQLAKQLRIARVRIANTFTRDGKKKGKRTAIRKAYAGRLVAAIIYRTEGISLTTIARRQTAKGVRAEGGRFYKGAFKVKKGKLAGQYFKRSPGSKRLPVFVPRIGVRKRGDRMFKFILHGGIGQRVFNKEFERLARVEINRTFKR